MALNSVFGEVFSAFHKCVSAASGKSQNEVAKGGEGLGRRVVSVMTTRR